MKTIFFHHNKLNACNKRKDNIRVTAEDMGLELHFEQMCMRNSTGPPPSVMAVLGYCLRLKHGPLKDLTSIPTKPF